MAWEWRNPFQENLQQALDKNRSAPPTQHELDKRQRQNKAAEHEQKLIESEERELEWALKVVDRVRDGKSVPPQDVLKAQAIVARVQGQRAKRAPKAQGWGGSVRQLFKFALIGVVGYAAYEHLSQDSRSSTEKPPPVAENPPTGEPVAPATPQPQRGLGLHLGALEPAAPAPAAAPPVDDIAARGRALGIDVPAPPAAPEPASPPAMEPGRLGVTLRDFDELTEEQRRSGGMSATEIGGVITEIQDGSPAKQYGLRQYDIIVAVNDIGVYDAAAAIKALRAVGPGNVATLLARRAGVAYKFTPVLTP